MQYPTQKLLSDKRVMAFFILAMLCVGYYYGCYRIPLFRLSALEAIPLNTPLIVQTKKPLQSLQTWRKQPYSLEWQGLQPVYKWIADVEYYQNLFQQTQTYPQLFSKAELTAGAQWAGGGSFGWLMVLENYQQDFDPQQFLKELGNTNNQISSFRGQKVYQFTDADGHSNALGYYKGLILLAQQPTMIELGLEQLDNINTNVHFADDFSRVYQSPNDSSCQLYINFRDLPILLNMLSPTVDKHIAQLSEQWTWAGFRLGTEQQIQLTGRIYPQQSARFWSELSSQSPALSPDISKLLPDNTALAVYIGVDNFQKFYKRIKTEENEDFGTYILPLIRDELVYFITDATSADLNSDKFVAMRCSDSKKADNLLTAYGQKFGELKTIEYQNFTIKQIAAKSLLKPIFGELIDPIQNPFYTCVDNYVVFCNSAAALQLWVEKYNFDKMLPQQPQHSAAALSLGKGNSLGIFINSQFCLSLLKICSQPQGHPFLEEQFDNFYHFSPIVAHFKPNRGHFAASISANYQPSGQKRTPANPQPDTSGQNLQKSSSNFVAWRTELKTQVKNAPQLLYFQAQNQHAILAQDTAKRIYLFDQSGNNLWEKQLESAMLGQAWAYDFYQNGDSKIAFCTEKFIYLLVGCADNNLYGYDKNGRPMTGFNPKAGIGKLATAPQTIYEKNQPLVVLFNKSGKVFLYNLDARAVGSPVQSEAAVGLIQTDQNAGRIALGQASGKILAINSQSKSFALAASKLNQSPQFVYANLYGDVRKDYLRYSNGQLQGHYYDEKNKFVPFLNTDLADKPSEIFEVQSALDIYSYLGGLSKTNQRIYLYDREGKLKTGFPLAGSTRFVIADLLLDKSETLIVGNQNAIIAYKLSVD